MSKTIYAHLLPDHRTVYEPYTTEFELLEPTYGCGKECIVPTDVRPWLNGQLHDAGLETQEFDYRGNDLAPPDWGKVKQLQPTQNRLLAQVAMHREGVMMFTTIAEMVAAIKLLLKSMPHDTTLCFLKLNFDFRHQPEELLQRQLEKQLSRIRKVKVLSEEELKKHLPKLAHIWVFCVLGSKPIYLDVNRLYSFSLSSEWKAWGNSTQRQVIFASEKCRLSQVQVAVIPWRDYRPPKARTEPRRNPLDIKQAVIWNNYRRNLWLADFYKALHNRRWNEELADRGIFFDSSFIHRKRPRINMLLEGIDQVEAMRSLLPECRFNTSPGEEHADEPIEADRTVSTIRHAMDHPINNDIIIRAAGHHGSLSELLTACRGQQLLIIDVADYRSASEREALRIRIGEYHCLGWNVIMAAHGNSRTIPVKALARAGGVASTRVA